MDNRRMVSVKRAIKALREARSYVARGWTQGPYAKAEDGGEVSSYSQDAAKWCAQGAIERVAYELCTPTGELFDRMQRAARKYGEHCHVCFNERQGRRQAEVVELFDSAIARAEKELA